MSDNIQEIMVQNTPITPNTQAPTGGYVEIMGETYYRISNSDQIPPFLMSLVSSSDHWLFVASNGGLTSGRNNADSALFPYETEDKIIAHHEETGPKTIIRATRNGQCHLWEPFSARYAGLYDCERHLYKNVPGNKLIFEEINHDLGLTLRYAWRTGQQFGAIKSSWLQNSGEPCRIDLLDGFQNILPYGATVQLQTTKSSLLDAYKRNELEPEPGLGIFSLSVTITDRAEPSESLRATVAWQTGLENPTYLLGRAQLDRFRRGEPLTTESDVCGQVGAYLVSSTFTLATDVEKCWHIAADVNQDAADIARLMGFLSQDNAVVSEQIEADIEQNTAALVHFVAAADGLQTTANQATTAHHFANVMFNIMRGGIFAEGYTVARDDLLDFIATRNQMVLKTHAVWFSSLPNHLPISDLYAQAAANGEPDIIRLCREYLPLMFSRRHGDPSRPWNYFSINLKKPDGSTNLAYQGNWRDIFQNWEPLLVSFPAYTQGVIAKFLNATTADGYNPYRVTRDGIEWEVPEPENPWSNIGYWSDHQIIYLQKLLEIAANFYPQLLRQLYGQPVFSYADVPYRLRSYTEMLKDWSNTITFDEAHNQAAEQCVAQIGTDGRLLRDGDGNIIHGTMVEKLLSLLLAKLTNLVPEGGIWMNTQRPEWNDANNALVGKGLSVVTVAYLRRFVAFWLAQLDEAHKTFTVNASIADLFSTVLSTFEAFQPHLKTGFTDTDRRRVMDKLGAAATEYRHKFYNDGLSAEQASISTATLRHFLTLIQRYLEHTLQANRRADNLFHAYNTLRLGEESAGIEHLYLMLEGQVAILSSGLLSADEALALLRSLCHSDLYRADQHTYMLYPNRRLPGFREKNNVSNGRLSGSRLVAALWMAKDSRLLERDETDTYHFNGTFRNANDVNRMLDLLAQEAEYAPLVETERNFILDLFEETFNHHAFTGRSGTFFAYEGLGSIYWHMVSKLLLAAQECYFSARDNSAPADTIAGLAEAYYDIRAGLGFNKTPAEYGAFPTDPYSHTPWGNGAHQPGMTGQVKEEILTRWGELGLSVQNGIIQFNPTLLRANEFLPEASAFSIIDIDGNETTTPLPKNSLAFEYCQVPIIYTLTDDEGIEIVFADGQSQTFPDTQLNVTLSRHIFSRDGHIRQINVFLKQMK